MTKRKATKSYRLPSGEHTKDGTAYVEAYEILAKSVLKYFPGYEWVAITYNYGLEFACREDYANGKFDFVHHFTLPLSACRSLIWDKVPERVRRFDLYSVLEENN